MTTWLHDLRPGDLMDALARGTALSVLALFGMSVLRARSADARELVGRWFLFALGLMPLLASSGISIALLPSVLAKEPIPPGPTTIGVPDAQAANTDAWVAMHAPAGWPSVAGWLALVWGSGTLGLVAFTALGHVLAVRRLFRNGATALPESLLQRLGVPARVPVHVTPSTCQPVVAGLLRPRIALPPAFLDWPAEHQRAVIAHELAHVERGDCRTALACRLARALWWPHPLVWLLDRRVALAREQACDDRAVRAQSAESAPAHAAALVAVARHVRSSLRLPPPTLAMTTTSQLEARVQSLLRSEANRSRVGPLARLAAAFLVLLVGLGCAAADTAKENEPHPPVEVAEAPRDGAAESQAPPIVIAIDPQGEVTYEGKAIGGQSVQSLVARLAQAEPLQVVILCSKSTPAAALMRVVDAAKLGGASAVSVETDRSPRLVSGANALLTPELRRCGPARVVLVFVVDERGRVNDPHLESSSDARFDQVALETVAAWRFEPGILDGVPVRTRMRLPMIFPAPEDGSDPHGETLHGVVLDADFDTPLDGARIELVETGVVAVTSTKGDFTFRQQSGSYTLRVTKQGYSPQEQAVTLAEGRPTDLRVRMRPIYVDLPPLDRR